MSNSDSSHFSVVRQDLNLLSNTIGILFQTVPYEIDLPHSGPLYERQVEFRAKSVSLQKQAAAQDIFRAAAGITTLCQHDWQSNPDILALWYKLATIIQDFSEHPSKKVATLVVKNGALIAFDANHVPDGIPKYGKHYEKSNRLIICSERCALERLEAMQVEIIKGRRRDDKHSKAIAAAMKELDSRLIERAKISTKLQGCDIITTTAPCLQCADVIAAYKEPPERIIAINGAPDNFNQSRKDSIKQGEQILSTRGVPIYYVSKKTFTPI